MVMDDADADVAAADTDVDVTSFDVPTAAGIRVRTENVEWRGQQSAPEGHPYCQ